MPLTFPSKRLSLSVILGVGAIRSRPMRKTPKRIQFLVGSFETWSVTIANKVALTCVFIIFVVTTTSIVSMVSDIVVVASSWAASIGDTVINVISVAGSTGIINSMGILFLIYLMKNTKTELKTELANMKTKLANMKTELANMKTELANISGSIARESAERFSVAIVLSRIELGGNIGIENLLKTNGKNQDHPHVLGHGVIAKAGIELFILTAAHIAIDAMEYTQNDSIYIMFLSSPGNVFGIDRHSMQLFVGDQYIRDGSVDVGAIKVQFTKTVEKLDFKPMHLENRHPFETEFFGRTLDFSVWGRAYCILEGNNRVALSTPSKPGCSGTPLFSSSGKLLSVLHGESKDRGQGGTMHSDSGDGVSRYVYVDRVTPNIGILNFWHSKFSNCAMKLESINPVEFDVRLNARAKNHQNPSAEAAELYVLVNTLAQKVADNPTTDSALRQRIRQFFAGPHFVMGDLIDLLLGMRQAETDAAGDASARILHNSLSSGTLDLGTIC